MCFFGTRRSYLVAGAAVLCWSGVAAGQTIEVLAVSGEIEPTSGSAFQAFGLPVVNNAGQVAYWAQVESGPAFRVFLETANGRSTIVQSGDLLPSGDVLSGPFTTDLRLTDGGLVLIDGAVPASFNFDRQPILSDGQTTSVVYRVDEPGPGAGETLLSTPFPTLNHSGQTAYAGVYVGSPSNAYVFREDLDQTQQIFLTQGDQVPGGGAALVSVFGPNINDSGQIAGRYTVDAGLETEAGVLLRIDENGPVELARTGQTVGATTIGGVSNPLINASGQIAFAIQDSFDEGIVLADDQGVSLLVDSVLPVIGRGEDLTIHHFTDDQKVIFTAEEDFGFRPAKGIFLADSAGVQAVVVEQQLTPDGADYFAIGGLGLNPSPAVNDAGDFAFAADLAENPDGPVTDTAMFRYDPDGGLVELFRTGDDLLGSTLAEFVVQGNEPAFSFQNPSALNTGINNAAGLAFFFTLADGRTGIASWEGQDALLGDYNGDGFVSQADLDLVLLNWGETVVPAEWVATDQFDGVQVSQNELDGVLLNWGDGTPPTATGLASIPEPATAGVFLALGGGLARRRR